MYRLKDRLWGHKSCTNTGVNQLLYEAIRRYGWSKFVWWIVEDNIPEDKLRERERYYIDLYNTKEPNGYNSAREESARIGRLAMQDPEVKERHRVATTIAMNRPGVQERRIANTDLEARNEKLRQRYIDDDELREKCASAGRMAMQDPAKRKKHGEAINAPGVQERKTETRRRNAREKAIAAGQIVLLDFDGDE